MTVTRLGISTAIVCVLLFRPSIARADVVLDWNAISVNTLIAEGQNPFSQARFGAIVQLAVFEAVNAITGDYEPYLGIVAPAGASADAAAIAAAHAVLTNYFTSPARLTALNNARAASLAAIPDGPAKSNGIATGVAAAAAMIALRTLDGSELLQFHVPASLDPG